MAQVQVITWNRDGTQAGTSTVDVDDAAVNADHLVSRALGALASNASFLGLGAPTNAQVLAQVQALTRQVNALIRLRLGHTDTIADS
jgi:hypothetical protein